MDIRKKIIVAAAVIIGCATATAQNVYHHEFSIFGGGGLSSLQYTPSIGDHDQGFGGTFGLGYTFFFTEHLGIGTGVDWTAHNSKFSLKDATHAIPALDASLFDNDANTYKEKQSAKFINIPLMLHFQTSTGAKSLFYAAGGVKYGIVVDGGTYSTKETWNSSVRELIPNEKLKLNNAWMLGLETGMKWQLAEKVFLHTGIYFDHGINDIMKDGHSKEFIASNGTGYNHHSVLISSFTNSAGDRLQFTKKVVPFDLGLKLKLSVGLGKIQTKAELAAIRAQEEARLKAERDAARLKADRDAAAAKAKQDALDAVARQKALADQAREKARQDSINAHAKVTAAHKELAKKHQKIDEARAKKEYTKVVEVYTLPLMEYDFNASALTPDMMGDVDARIATMKANPKLFVICEGHTDNFGTVKENLQVGKERADAVKNYMVKKGIDAKRIKAVSKGEINPVALNDVEENRHHNRRVVFVFNEK